jgi:predicted MPP superfamily phosphohydrolase
MAASAISAAGLALYSGEIARHHIEIVQRTIYLRNLPAAFDGMTLAQVSDIHLHEFTEPYFLREAVARINRLRPDALLLTGDYVSHEVMPRRIEIGSAWLCANILNEIECTHRYAVLGNHDHAVNAKAVAAALSANGITVLTNSFIPLRRGSAQIWLAGLDDPVAGHPDPDEAIPAAIRNRHEEPIVLLCHAPDYADELLDQPAGAAVSLMLSGHTHGGQVRLPFVGAMQLPDLGKRYVEGFFRLQNMQLYVNRGLGTVGLPFRLNCPPEITWLTLRRGEPATA